MLIVELGELVIAEVVLVVEVLSGELFVVVTIFELAIVDSVSVGVSIDNVVLDNCFVVIDAAPNAQYGSAKETGFSIPIEFFSEHGKFAQTLTLTSGPQIS